MPSPSGRNTTNSFLPAGKGFGRLASASGNPSGAYDAASGLRGSRPQPAKRALTPAMVTKIFGAVHQHLTPSDRSKFLALAQDATLDAGLPDDADGPPKLPADVIARILNAIGPHLASEDLSEFQRMLAAASAEEPVLGQQKAVAPNKSALNGAQDAAHRASLTTLYPHIAAINRDRAGEAIPVSRKKPPVAMDSAGVADFDAMYPGAARIGAA